MKAKIWYEVPLDNEGLARLQPHAEVIVQGSREQIPGAIAVVISAQLEANGAFMDFCGSALKAIVRPGIGVDNVDLQAATERGILVLHTPDAPTESTAEHTVALIMALAKRVVAADRWLTDRALERNVMLGMELKGRVLGLAGFGRIGRRVAQICGPGLQMEVIFYDPFLPADALIPWPEVTRVASMEEIWRRSDVISLHTPLSAETRHSVGEAQFRKMKPTAYLVNASRGLVVDELALIRALQAKVIAGAAVDVTEIEPPLANNPLLTMHNVVVTPHIASFTDLGMAGMRRGVVDLLLQLLAGEKPTDIANRAVWPGRMKQ